MSYTHKSTLRDRTKFLCSKIELEHEQQQELEMEHEQKIWPKWAIYLEIIMTLIKEVSFDFLKLKWIFM